MSKLVNIPYLEDSDFNADNSLKPYVNKGKPCVIMVQGNFCGYCTQAKPAFQKLASLSGVALCTLQIDGAPQEKAAAKRVSILDKSYRGVPTYLGFNAQGKYVATHKGGRDTASIESFAKSL